MATDSKSSKAPSFYSAAADMAMQGGKQGAGTGAAPGAGASGDTAAEETKIISTLLEVYQKWETLTKDPKRKEKIQQLASITKEIQTGQAGGDGKPPAAADMSGGPTPDAMAGAGAGGMAGGGAPSGAGAGQTVPA
jgi:hypothetical protein